MMPRKSFFAILSGSALIVLIILILASSAGAAQYRVLYKFKAGIDGGLPYGGVVIDQTGRLYGTTMGGGAYGNGTVFQLVSNPDGTWTENVLYSFTGGADGGMPEAGLIFDAAGSLYGTTVIGTNVCGAVFKLAPSPDGSWTESVLHSFTRKADGCQPYAGLIFDTSGNLYGTTHSSHHGKGVGIVFKLTPNPDGSWMEDVLHNFTRGSDGSQPYSDVVLDAEGNLYGTTLYGGIDGYGMVFRLTPNPDGSWTESRPHVFKGPDGVYPSAGLILDAAGNLYGTTGGGGKAHDSGTVFKLTPYPDGTWKRTTLHGFKGKDGEFPQAGLVFDAAGNLYGTTYVGGKYDCGGYGCGVVFKLVPNQDGSWKESVLHNFNGKDGANPYAGLIVDAAGNLYGTTLYGGKGGNQGSGVVFEITP